MGLIGVGDGVDVGGDSGGIGGGGGEKSIYSRSHPALSVSERMRIREVTKCFTFSPFIADFIVSRGRD